MSKRTVRAKAVHGELGFSRNGNEEVAVQFEILSGETSGNMITWWGYFTEKSADRTLQSLMNAGWDGSDITDLNGLGSKEVELELVIDTYGGKQREKVAWVNKPKGPRTKAMSEADKLSFAEKMRGRTLALQKQVPSQVGNSAVADDDDIPF